ncbi:MAG: hypothetical protein A2Y34_13720 [Spirochaetes bacterium GWC1_27_15]|nr:MAG: hypothetical protein A2Z98_06400 [Spirochaetes bacterium GWB1_27_13]OHD27526.1 MAG: hypothetical protein A2Y34_13720 [Spirochaetes bacterium GWC1_27_15]
MKICIPTENNNGLNSTVYGHFGSAPYFIIYDTNYNKIEVINNMDKNHQHGQCNPLASFVEKPIDVMVTGGIGGGALKKLNANGIKAYRSTKEATVSEVIKNYESNKLVEITLNDTCSHNHGCH